MELETTIQEIDNDALFENINEGTEKENLTAELSYHSKDTNGNMSPEEVFDGPIKDFAIELLEAERLFDSYFNNFQDLAYYSEVISEDRIEDSSIIDNARHNMSAIFRYDDYISLQMSNFLCASDVVGYFANDIPTEDISAMVEYISNIDNMVNLRKNFNYFINNVDDLTKLALLNIKITQGRYVNVLSECYNLVITINSLTNLIHQIIDEEISDSYIDILATSKMYLYGYNQLPDPVLLGGEPLVNVKEDLKEAIGAFQEATKELENVLIEKYVENS